MTEIQDYSRQTSQAFLQSAIIIDDLMNWSDGNISPEMSEGASDVSSDDVELIDPNDFEDITVEPEMEIPASGGRSDINAMELIRSFSEQGIICSAYEWRSENKSPPKSIEKADLIILDWKLENQTGDDEGIITTGIIQECLKRDAKSGGRLRFITIYTSHDESIIYDELKGALDNVEEHSVELIDQEGTKFLNARYQGKHVTCRIKVFKKSVNEKDLPGKIISSFSEFVMGFLPNIALTAITEIRNQTYELLAKYHVGLDKALISHFTILKTQKNIHDISEMLLKDYTVGLISSHIGDRLLLSPNVKKSASQDRILQTLQDMDDVEVSLGEDSLSDVDKFLSIISADGHKAFINNAIEAFGLKHDPADGETERKEKKDKRDLFKKKNQPALILQDRGDEKKELACLDLYTSSKKNRENGHPLKLGTVLRCVPDGQYYVCVQPLCDSTRLVTTRDYPFPFLKLSANQTKSPSETLLYVHDRAYKKLFCVPKPSNISMFSFKANPETKDIRGYKYRTQRFKSSGEHKLVFEWVAELKNVYAQEIAHGLASQGSRIGSDKFEWLRLDLP